MKIYFAWVDEGEKYDPLKHSREDLDIFSLHMQEKEGSYPRAILWIRPPGSLWPGKKEAILSAKEKILFRGRLVQRSLKGRGESVEIKLVARPGDVQGALKKIEDSLKQTCAYDPLFMEDPDHPKIHELLEGCSELIYWGRENEGPSLSSLFEGKKTLIFTESDRLGNLKCAVVQSPLAAVEMEISAEWIQEAEGKKDLSPLVGPAFPEGIVNTLTGESLKKSWFPEWTVLGRSGYTVERSSLKEISPSFTGSLNIYPKTSIPLWEPEGDSKEPYYIKRSWFKVKELILQWHYKQKRRETVQFCLKQNLQEEVNAEKYKKIKMRLQNIASEKAIPLWQVKHRYAKGFRVQFRGKIYECLQYHLAREPFGEEKWVEVGNVSPTLSVDSFFTTDRGKQAVLKAVDVARAHLAYRSRSVEVSFLLPLDRAVELTCDHQVIVEDRRLPQGKIIGKVKKLILSKEGRTGSSWGEVILACAVGSERENHSPVKISNPYVERSYMKSGYILDEREEILASKGIRLKSWVGQQPTHRGLRNETFSLKDMVENIDVINGAVMQNRELEKVQCAGRDAVKKVLSKNQTHIKIQLKDIGSVGVLNHVIKIPIAVHYTPPQHICLKGEWGCQGL